MSTRYPLTPACMFRNAAPDGRSYAIWDGPTWVGYVELAGWRWRAWARGVGWVGEARTEASAAALIVPELSPRMRQMETV